MAVSKIGTIVQSGTPAKASDINLLFNKFDGTGEVIDTLNAVENEIVTARGTETDLNTRITNDETRIINLETEVSTARGTATDLNGRLSISLNDDGTLKVSGIVDGTITEAKLDVLNDPVDNYVLRWNATAGQLEWVDAGAAEDTFQVKVDAVDTPDFLNAKVDNTTITINVDKKLQAIFTQVGGTGNENKLVATNSSGKLDNSLLNTGSGGGIDADSVDGYEPSNASGGLAINNGTVNTDLNADKVDGVDVATTPTANTLLPLDANAKFPNSVLYTGVGNGLDADTVDGFHASQTPTANTITVADTNGYINNWIEQGSGSGLDADLVRGGEPVKLSTNGTEIVKTDDTYIKNQCTAWCIFDGTGTILDSYNISSLTILTTGIGKFTFTTPMSSNNYVVVAIGGGGDVTSRNVALGNDSTSGSDYEMPTTDYFTLNFRSISNNTLSALDGTSIEKMAVVVFGGK